MINHICHFNNIAGPECNIYNRLVTVLTIGLMKRSYFGGFRVKPSPTKQTFVTILFHAFFCLFPVLMTLRTSVSPCARTLGRGTSHLPYKIWTFASRNTFLFSWEIFGQQARPYCIFISHPYIDSAEARYLQPSLSSSVWSCWTEP